MVKLSFLSRLCRFLGNQRGEVAAGNPDAGGSNGNLPWYQPAEALKTSDPELWSSLEKRSEKDFPSFVKSALNLEKKLGTSIVPPGKDAKSEEIAAFRQKIYGTGVFKAPPESGDKYEIKLDAIPESMRSEETVKSLRSWAHKHGLSQEGLAELVDIETARYNGVVKPSLAYTKEQGEKALQDFSTEIGKPVKELEAYGAAWLAKNFTEAEVKAMGDSGFGNSPVAIKFAVRAGLDTGEDISAIAGGGGDAIDADYEDVRKAMSDPTHPDHDAWLGKKGQAAQDTFMAKMEVAYRRHHGVGNSAQGGAE